MWKLVCLTSLFTLVFSADDIRELIDVGKFFRIFSNKKSNFLQFLRIVQLVNFLYLIAFK